jgi:hypothetical protein
MKIITILEVFEMNKVKVALILLTITIIVLPIASIVFVYRNNLSELIIPPELQNLANSSSTIDSFNDESGMFISNITAPTPLGEPMYDSATGVFSYAINFTNPLQTSISVDQVSAQLESKSNNELLCNVSITQPINIASGANGIINTTGIISQDKLDQLENQYKTGTLDLNDLALKNINVVANGVTLHFDHFDLNTIKSLGGSDE